MSRKWPGSLITKTKVTPAGPYEGGAASGVWTLAEALQWTGKELWPIAGNTPPEIIFIGGVTTVGASGVQVLTISTVNASTTGDAEDWADLSVALRTGPAGCGSSTRAVWGATNVSPYDAIQYIEYASGGTGAAFGDLFGNYNYTGVAALSTSTRGCWAGGDSTDSADNIIYIILSSTGDSLDFGDLTLSRYQMVGMASATRGLWCAGELGGNPTTRVDYITVASTGNAIDFGGGVYSRYAGGGANGTTGIYAGGNTDAYAEVNIIAEKAIASLGDFSDFGDLSQGLDQLAGASSSTRVLFAGGMNSSSARVNEIQYITIASSGNAVDFGDLLQTTNDLAATSSVQGNF